MYVQAITSFRVTQKAATAKAIDRYVELSKAHQKGDPRLKGIIESIFARCMAEGEYKQVSLTLIFWT